MVDVSTALHIFCSYSSTMMSCHGQGCDQRETFWLTGKEDGVFEPDEKYDITEVGYHSGPGLCKYGPC